MSFNVDHGVAAPVRKSGPGICLYPWARMTDVSRNPSFFVPTTTYDDARKRQPGMTGNGRMFFKRRGIDAKFATRTYRAGEDPVTGANTPGIRVWRIK